MDMNEATQIQDKFASALDRRQVCSFDIEFVDNQTSPLIHSSARFLYFLEGECVFSINGCDYNIRENCMVAVMAWDITVIKDVKSPLTFQKIVYNGDFINGYLRTLYNPKNLLITIYDEIKDYPVIECDEEQARLIQAYVNQIRKDLGEESIIEKIKFKEFSDAYVTSNLVSLLVLFNRFSKEHRQNRIIVNDELHLTNQIFRYINSHLQSKITLDKLSKIFYVSESTIAKYLQINVGFNFSEMLNEIRINKSIDLLLYSDLSLNTIAQIVGYTDASHYFKAFAHKFDVTPNEYRKMYQNNEDILKKKESEVIYKVLDYIDENYLNDKISGSIVARKFGLSMIELNHLLLYQVERTFDDYVNWLRISKASELLITTDLAVTDIAIEVGYNTTKTFTRIFTNLRNVTPGYFRRKVNLQKENGDIITTSLHHD